MFKKWHLSQEKKKIFWPKYLKKISHKCVWIYVLRSVSITLYLLVIKQTFKVHMSILYEYSDNTIYIYTPLNNRLLTI